MSKSHGFRPFVLNILLEFKDGIYDNLPQQRGLVDKPGILVLTSISYVKIGSVRS